MIMLACAILTTIAAAAVPPTDFDAMIAEVQAKAKEILDKGHGYASFWCTEENGGYREENIEMGEKFEDNTDAPEPSDDEPTELAAAEHCEGGKGQMMMFAQRLSGVALA